MRTRRLPIPELVVGSAVAGAVFGTTAGVPIPAGWPLGFIIGAATGLSVSPVIAKSLMRLEEPIASLLLVSILTQAAIAACMRLTGDPWLAWGVSLLSYIGLAVFAGGFFRRRTVPVDPTRCPTCDYDIRGLRDARCPECGAAIGLDAPAVDPRAAFLKSRSAPSLGKPAARRNRRPTPQG